MQRAYSVLAFVGIVAGMATSADTRAASSSKSGPAPLQSLRSSVGDTAIHGGAFMEPTEFVDQDIRDVLRAVAKAYDLNIFPYPEVKGKVAVTLHRMPVLDALRNIVEPLGYELAWDGQAYLVRLPRPHIQGTIEVGRNAISMTVKNQEIQAFADEYGHRTGLNILVDRNAKGQVSGVLRDVDPIDGLKAILTASGFDLRTQGEAWIVASSEERSQSPGVRTARVDLSVRKGKVTANLHQAALSDVIQQMSDQGGYNTITWGQLGGTVDANIKGLAFQEALGLILQGTPFTFAIQDSVLVIGDRNPASASGQALASTEIYYLKHLRADKVVPMIPKSLANQGVQAVTELNALLLTGTTESNDKVKEFLGALDQEVPQVVIEAIIVEFTRKRTSELGIKKYSGSTTSGTTVNGPALIGKVSVDGSATIGGFDFATVTLLPQNFGLQLNALESAELARVLARPRLTTLNGQAATINIGNSDYFQVSTTSSTGVVSTDYRAFSSGITLTITPFLTKSGFITAEIKPEIKTPTSASSSDSNKPPSTSTRSLSTNVRLRDGETLVLGGLIQTTDLISNEGVPLLSAIPIIGKIFTYRTRNKETTELAIFITPHVMVGSDTGINVRKAVEIMENRVAGPTIDLPFHAEDPLQPTAEDSARGKPAAPSPDTVVGAVPPRKKVIVLVPDTASRPRVSSQGVGSHSDAPTPIQTAVPRQATWETSRTESDRETPTGTSAQEAPLVSTQTRETGSAEATSSSGSSTDSSTNGPDTPSR